MPLLEMVIASDKAGSAKSIRGSVTNLQLRQDWQASFVPMGWQTSFTPMDEQKNIPPDYPIPSLGNTPILDPFLDPMDY